MGLHGAQHHTWQVGGWSALLHVSFTSH
jgi:hypothetical protein